MAENKNINRDPDEDISRMMSSRRPQNGTGQSLPRNPNYRPPQRAGTRIARAAENGEASAFENGESHPSNSMRASAQAASHRVNNARASEPGAVPHGNGVKASVQGAAHGNAVRAAANRAKDDDDDVKVATPNIKARDNGATRVTDSVPKAESTSLEAEKAKKDKKKTDADVGSQLVIGLIRAVVYLVCVSVVAGLLAIFIINVGNDVYALVKSDEVIEVTIPEGATNADVAEVLWENGVIKYKSMFKLYGDLKKIKDEYVAGEYSVTPSTSYGELYYSFKEKPISGTSWITIPEGYTVDEFIDLMVSYGIGTREKYVDVINNYDFDYWFVQELKENGWNENRYYRLEGYLFPDTYEFYNASSELTVVNKLLERFNQIYTESYKERAEELGMKTDDIVTIASMIEKEAGSSADYRNVSSVFYNRLKSPQKFPKMESDATVVYAITHDTGERPKKVTSETLQYESPYNSYQNDGLPPGAIANPGMNALKYALYPADTNYYYFVSYDDGTTAFASTKAEHDANVKILRGE